MLAKNTVQGHNEFGVDVRDGGRGFFSGNMLFGNNVNLCVQTWGNPIFEANVIRKATRTGVFLRHTGMCVLGRMCSGARVMAS